MKESLNQQAKLGLFTLFCLLCLQLAAQSLPEKQKSGLRAPANIKIDGKAIEWGGNFEAYNHATDIFYTMANDNDNLYFVIQATKPRIIEKILNVGVTITVNSKNEKDEKAPDAVSINFPIIEYKDVPPIIIDAGAKTTDIMLSSAPGDTHSYKPEFDVKPSDSLKDAATMLLNKAVKTINIKGVPEFEDGELSVYNDKDIKVGVAFNHSGAYTYELAVPLKYLHLSINDAKKFSYNIKLQNRLDVLRHGMVTRYTRPNRQSPNIDMDLDLDSTTDFWGEYTLAKAP